MLILEPLIEQSVPHIPVEMPFTVTPRPKPQTQSLNPYPLPGAPHTTHRVTNTKCNLQVTVVYVPSLRLAGSDLGIEVPGWRVEGGGWQLEGGDIRV